MRMMALAAGYLAACAMAGLTGPGWMESTNGQLTALVLAIPVVLLAVIQTVKRLHDLGLSARTLLANRIPGLSLAAGLAVVFMNGDEESNEYGPATLVPTRGWLTRTAQ